ncbi:hypothetical protein ACIBFB_26525 [Nocardiopsis sp. NPDC050513]|uniref:hypothetical protein n=1 Tax=Nocardiopsis sp. NPDC050513 TaxID=3364338 RepID=UPI00379B9430
MTTTHAMPTVPPQYRWPETTMTNPAPDTPFQVHLLVRESGEYEDTTTTVIAALTCEEEASRLMRVREEIEDQGDAVSYSIETVTVHATAAAALGLA